MRTAPPYRDLRGGGGACQRAAEGLGCEQQGVCVGEDDDVGVPREGENGSFPSKVGEFSLQYSITLY